MEEIVCKVTDRILTIVVLPVDDNKEVAPMKSAVAYRKSLSYDKDQSEVVVRFSRMGKAYKVEKGRRKVFALASVYIGKRTRPQLEKIVISCWLWAPANQIIKDFVNGKTST